MWCIYKNHGKIKTSETKGIERTTFEKHNKIKQTKLSHDKRTLEEQRIEFSNQKFLATSLSGLIVWTIIGLIGIFFSDFIAVWVIFIGTGSIVYLAVFLSKYTGEDFLDKTKPTNEFDKLFFFTVAQALLTYSIAIPFFIIDYSSLPMTVGILTGLMWLPFSWIINHWIGIFHAVMRTVLVLTLWYLMPEYRFIVIPFGIVLIYLITILVLKSRKKVEESRVTIMENP